MNARPPGIARALLSLATEADERPWLLADLDEMYHVRRANGGRVRADVWYCKQVIRSIPPLLARRLEPGRPRPTPSAAPTMSRHAGITSDSMATVVYHLRHAFRRLIREPAFTVAAVLTLALGIGGSAAVFALVEAVLLRPLPYPDADHLVIVNYHESRSGITKEFIPMGDAVDIVARQTTFDLIGSYGYSGQLTVTSAAEPYQVSVMGGMPAVLAALGVRPILGRVFEASDATTTGPALSVIIGYDLWQTKFGGDPHIVGKSVGIGQIPRTIIGVAPRGFTFRSTKPVDIIMPNSLPLQAPVTRAAGWAFLLGHLRPGRTIADAQRDLARISNQLEREFPASNASTSYFAVSLRDALVGNTKMPLVLLLAAVAVVLLIACVNVANLLLARSLARRREMAVRLALGAARGRLALQLLIESLVLAASAAVCGLLIAVWGSRALVALVPTSVQAPGLADVRINGLVIAFALIVTLVTTMLFGMVAMTTVRGDGTAALLVGAGRTSASGSVRQAASGLVVLEIALAIMLLFGAGLVIRSFNSLLSVDPGFRYDHVMTMTASIPSQRYRDTLAREGFYRSAMAALRAVPGVQAIGRAAVVPLTGNNWTVPFERADKPVAAGERPPEVGWQAASGEFFKALGIPLIAGRLFDERDRPGGPTVVIVSEAIQRRFFPNESAVGKLIKTGGGSREIVGVVGNIRRAGLRDDPRADLYFSDEQSPGTQTTFFIRTAGEPANATPALQAALRSVESRITFIQTQSLGDIAAESVRTTKLVLWLLGVFAATALALAAVGIYGVMSYIVRQRTKEIGTRIALGAGGADIIWLIMRQGATLAIVGAIIGLGVGLVATRSLGSLLYNVTSSDPISMATATAVLVGAVLAACYIPARRAAAVDPVQTLAEQ